MSGGSEYLFKKNGKDTHCQPVGCYSLADGKPNHLLVGKDRSQLVNLSPSNKSITRFQRCLRVLRTYPDGARQCHLLQICCPFLGPWPSLCKSKRAMTTYSNFKRSRSERRAAPYLPDVHVHVPLHAKHHPQPFAANTMSGVTILFFLRSMRTRVGAAWLLSTAQHSWGPILPVTPLPRLWEGKDKHGPSLPPSHQRIGSGQW